MKRRMGEVSDTGGSDTADPAGIATSEVSLAGERALLSAAEVAGYLGVNQGTVYRWCREGRLPCVKVGKYWRLRRKALEGFLAEQEHREERPATLDGRLDSFVEMPDNVLGIAQTTELMHRLDAAFFRVGQARGALLVKFHGGESGSEEELRKGLEQAGLEVDRLHREGRLRFLAEADAGSPGRRPEALGRLAGEQKQSGRPVWAAFDWEQRLAPGAALDQQQALTRLVENRRIVVKTSVLEEVTDGWSPALWRRAQTLHPATIWLSEAGLALNRVTPLPPH